MANNKIKVIFETITPLYTGDAWQEFKEIRPLSLIGSLRFWFEVICYFGGICSESDFDKKKGRFEKDIKNDEIKKKLSEYGTDFWGQIEALKELKIPLPAIIFGTTGWKSLIEIESIICLEDYCFGNKLNLPDRFCISKDKSREIKEWRKCPPNWSFFYFKIPYFWGKFEVIFRVPEEIEETIFFPLLNFMDKYGYWGGSWNVGYGRLKVLSVNSLENGWQKDKFDFSKFGKNENICIKYNDNQECKNGLIKYIKHNTDLKKRDLEIKYWKYNKCDSSIKNMLKTLINLIIEKSNLRRSLNDQKERHYVFGKTGNIPEEDLPQGSKILPYINRLDESTYECGLLSIAGILNLYQEPKNEQQ
jgi:CRISPR-associated protein Cmr1